MGYCPICKTSSNLEQPTGGDYRRVECRKCGKYQITGSTLAMLDSRLKDAKSVARLSHSTRAMSSKSVIEWPEINSFNLDDMIKQPLPTVDRQMTNLLAWAAADLDDDQLGAVELPDEEDLTAVIGTLDGQRVDDLISETAKAKLIRLVPDRAISITPAGWERLRPAAKSEARSEALAPAPVSTKAGATVKAHCGVCHGEKNSWLHAEYTQKGGDGADAWSETYQTVQCCGCDKLSVRHEVWRSEWDEADFDEQGRSVTRRVARVTHHPAQTVRAKPPWAVALGDEVLRDVINESYLALNGGLRMLASVGARTLLDRAGNILVGDVKGGFEGKLSALATAGRISQSDKEALDAVADAGNASAHRGYAPEAERLNHIFDVIENFLERAFILTPAAAEIRKTTPPRAKRP
ncbi:DUF4145 domain-containing protein [Bradyrhizobium sp. LA7.1]|uniref:DUF4145 domain-containing protein n=1 Tax=Bradyrhizobium sp. LA7.1 TaxID=3156324 RepID=UPI00339A0ECC